MARDNKNDAERTEATQVKSQQAQAAEASAENTAAMGQQSQRQSGSAETDSKVENDPVKRLEKTGEPQFFDTTIAKVVTDEETGEERVVMSDNISKGDRLKREVDAEKAEKRAKEAKDAADRDKDKK